MTAVFPDVLIAPGTPGLPERFFDRFVFNLHPADGSAPSVIFGLGVYPARDVIDGFAIVVSSAEQRNLRLSDELSATRATATGGALGPLSWDVAEPMRTWHAALGPNPAGLEFDLTWRARTSAWTGDVAVANTDGTASSFTHLFQSGRYEGAVRIDGREARVDGWYGQRDRSRGVRTMAGGQGLHLWVQAQFPDRSVGFLTAESRGHERLLLAGAVMHESGGSTPSPTCGMTCASTTASTCAAVGSRSPRRAAPSTASMPTPPRAAATCPAAGTGDSMAAPGDAAMSSTTPTRWTARYPPGSWIPR